MSRNEKGSQMDTPYVSRAGSTEPGVPPIDLKPMLIIIGSAVLGLVLGISASDGRGDPDLISWINLPGDLFIRALKCVVLPLVFVNIILSVVDMIQAGKASTVGLYTIALYLLTTFIASIEGLITVLMFKSAFSDQNIDEPPPIAEVVIRCPFDNLILNTPTFLNEELQCVSEGELFIIDNSNEFLLVNEDTVVADDITFTQTLQDGIFRKMVSENIVNDFVQDNFVGVIVVAILFGFSSQALQSQPRVFVELLEESNMIFYKIIDWIIFLTPIAVFSLVAGSLGNEEDLSGVFSDIGVLMACALIAFFIHFLAYQALFIAFVKKNPIPYLKYMFPVQVFAFASASSAASLPLSLKCVEATGEVPASISNFVLSLGSTVNMDGGAIYFPTAIVFLAVSSGLEDELDAAAYFLIILLSTIGSAGAAPVPSASLVLIITAFNTVFDTTGTPEAFSLILGVDWLMDRFRTLLNVTGNVYMARIVTAVSDSELSPESESD